jgi:peptide/nickel transport system substrate-binding protein
LSNFDPSNHAARDRTRSGRATGVGKDALKGVLLIGLATFGTVRSGAADEARHALAMHGEPAMPEGFTRLPYANPAAPKGGRFVQGVLGTFDNLNPFIVKGIALPSIRGYVVESLMARGFDEPFTLYGLLASSVETDPQRSYVTFRLNPAARFSDGTPVTAEDAIFSWKLCAIKAGQTIAPIRHVTTKSPASKGCALIFRKR